MRIDIAEVVTKESTPPKWLIEDTFYRGQVICLAGAPGIGKSFMCHYLTFCIASGLPFLGRAVAKAKVLYFDEENSKAELEEYLRWIWKDTETPIDLPVVTKNVQLEHFSVSQHGGLRFDYMQGLSREFKPDLIVLDTVSAICGIKDENDNAEAGEVIRKLRSIKEASHPDTVLLLIKHQRHNIDPGDTRLTIRGAKIWIGAVDQTIFHVPSPGRPTVERRFKTTRWIAGKGRAFSLKSPLIIRPREMTSCIKGFHSNIEELTPNK